MKKTIYILVIAGIGIFFHTRGIDWGIPDQERIGLVFGDIETLRDMSDSMLSTHEEIRKMQIHYGAEYPPDYDTSKKISLNIKGGRKEISLEIVNSMRSYLLRTYGADEQAVLSSLSKMNPSKLDLNPHFFEYGGVYLYPLAAFLKLCSLCGFLELKNEMKYYFFNPEKMGDLYKFSRLFGALFFVFSGIVFYFLCTRITQDNLLSFIISLLFVSLPGFAIWSHYLKPYTYGMLWVICSLLFIFKFIDEKKTLWLILASCFAGFSLGSLLSYGLVIFAIFCSIFLFSFTPKDILRNLVLCCTFFVVSYLITNPYVLISWKEFFDEIGYIRSYWKGSANFENLKYFSTVSLKYGLGMAVWIVSIFYFLVCLLTLEKKFLLAFLTLLPCFVYFGLNTGRWVHYSFILYPFIFLIIAVGASKLRKSISFLIFLPVFIWTFAFTFSYVNLFPGENIRTLAGRWINENVPEKKRVGLLEAPSPWRTPPFQYLKYNLLIGEPALTNAQYYVISEYQWVRGRSFQKIKTLFADYDIIKEFRRFPVFLKWTFSHQENIPYDWCHPNPAILIWKKRI